MTAIEDCSYSIWKLTKILSLNLRLLLLQADFITSPGVAVNHEDKASAFSIPVPYCVSFL